MCIYIYIYNTYTYSESLLSILKLKIYYVLKNIDNLNKVIFRLSIF